MNVDRVVFHIEQIARGPAHHDVVQPDVAQGTAQLRYVHLDARPNGLGRLLTPHGVHQLLQGHDPPGVHCQSRDGALILTPDIVAVDP